MHDDYAILINYSVTNGLDSAWDLRILTFSSNYQISFSIFLAFA